MDSFVDILIRFKENSFEKCIHQQVRSCNTQYYKFAGNKNQVKSLNFGNVLQIKIFITYMKLVLILRD